MEAPNTTELNLDALCDLLDDDEEELAENNVPEDKVQDKKHTADDSKKEQNTTEIPAMQPSVDVLQAQILEMQQKMMYMQKQLEEKGEKSTNKTLKDVDIFNLPGNSSVGACKSPVKTNPFAEGVDRPMQFPTAKTFHETPKYGPALSKKVTRSLDTDEKAQLFRSLSKKDKAKKEKVGFSSIEIAAQDLECSSDDTDVDEEGNRNTVGSNYSEYGREIQNQIKRQAHQPINSNAETNQLSKQSSAGNFYSNQLLSRSKTIPSQGFDTLKGSTMNLSRNSANVRLPNNLITEKHSRIRISNPLINQTALDLALVGRKMIPLHKIKTAIAMKETEGDWATIGVIFSQNICHIKKWKYLYAMEYD